MKYEENQLKETDQLLVDKVKAPSPISTCLRWTTNVLALTATFFFSGVIFGWAPLQLMLCREGQYAKMCVEESLAQLGLKESQAGPLCSEQTNALAGMFTTGQFFLSFSSFLIGMALDYFPKSILLTVTAVLEVSGLLLLAISDTTDEESDRDYFYMAYALLAIGGSATMLSAFPASFLLKDYQAGLLAMISCLFDASSIIFSIGMTLQDNLGWSRHDMLLLYMFWGVAVYVPLIACWVILERKNWQQVLEIEDDAEQKLLRQQGLEDNDELFPQDTNADPKFLAHVTRIQKMNILSQLKTRDFAFTMFFVATHMLQANYYIMSVDAFLLSLGDDDAKYAKIFSWALPCGIFFVPFIERTVTYLGIVNTLHTTNVIALIFGASLLISALSYQVVNFFIFTCFRAYLYATINSLIATTFGVATMGRIIGLVFTAAAVFGLVQYPISVVSEVTFDGDYTPMNSMLLVVAFLPCIATFHYGRYISRSVYSESVDLTPEEHFQARKRAQMSPGLILSCPGSEIVNSIRRSRRMYDDDDLA